MAKCITIILVVVCGLLLGGATYCTTQYFLLFNGRYETLKYEASYFRLPMLNLANNDTLLEYNVAANVTVKNPNKNGAYLIEEAQAVLFSAVNETYLNQTAILNQQDRFIKRKYPDRLTIWLFVGARPVVFGEAEVAKFKNTEVFDLILRLYVNCITRIGGRIRRYQHNVSCYLNFPSNLPFNSTDCVVDQVIRIH